jgi:twitching motility protein PilU
VAFAETGHLAISTLHANNANQALDRIINFFPEERKAQLLNDLGNNIRAIVSQRLVPTVDGKRCAAIEILLGSHTIKQMIMKDQLTDIKEAMKKSENQGMKTFDSALFDLAKSGKITEEEALKNADSANNLRLRFKLSGPSDNEDENELLMRGQLPSQVSAATAVKEAKAKLAAAQLAKKSQDKPAKTEDNSIHAAMAQQIASRKAANDSDGSKAGDGAKLAAAAQAFELSLEVNKEPEPDSPDDSDQDDSAQFGMGKIG